MADTELLQGENRELAIPVDGDRIYGDLTLVPNAKGLVLFAHGSGSSRHSGRNRSVAQVLNRAGMHTLLFDLLTSREDEVDQMTREHRFDIPLLARRLEQASEWVRQQAGLQTVPLGYFGASTGAAAALIAAANRPGDVSAVVSRGGRADMAGDDLKRVKAPTLLIVGGRDDVVLDLNRQAMERLRCTRELEVVDGATHLFEEFGALEAVSQLARNWFLRHFQ